MRVRVRRTAVARLSLRLHAPDRTTLVSHSAATDWSTPASATLPAATTPSLSDFWAGRGGWMLQNIDIRDVLFRTHVGFKEKEPVGLRHMSAVVGFGDTLFSWTEPCGTATQE